MNCLNTHRHKPIFSWCNRKHSLWNVIRNYTVWFSQAHILFLCINGGYIQNSMHSSLFRPADRPTNRSASRLSIMCAKHNPLKINNCYNILMEMHIFNVNNSSIIIYRTMKVLLYVGGKCEYVSVCAALLFLCKVNRLNERMGMKGGEGESGRERKGIDSKGTTKSALVVVVVAVVSFKW